MLCVAIPADLERLLDGIPAQVPVWRGAGFSRPIPCRLPPRPCLSRCMPRRPEIRPVEKEGAKRQDAAKPHASPLQDGYMSPRGRIAVRFVFVHWQGVLVEKPIQRTAYAVGVPVLRWPFRGPPVHVLVGSLVIVEFGHILGQREGHASEFEECLEGRKELKCARRLPHRRCSLGS